MKRNFERYLIVGGLLWIILWTGHTIAHGPLNPAPETGRFLGQSSMFYAVWMMFLAPMPLALGWAGFYRYIEGKWRVSRLIGEILGIAGLLTSFIGGCAGVFAFIRHGFNHADLEIVWLIIVFGQIMLLLGLLVFSIGMLRSRTFGLAVRLIPLAVAFSLPLLHFLRRPSSSLLDWGPVTGYTLLAAIGVLFGLNWIVLGLAVALKKRRK